MPSLEQDKEENLPLVAEYGSIEEAIAPKQGPTTTQTPTSVSWAPRAAIAMVLVVGSTLAVAAWSQEVDSKSTTTTNLGLKDVASLPTQETAVFTTGDDDATCQASCYNETCNYWVDTFNATCSWLEAEKGCDCTAFACE